MAEITKTFKLFDKDGSDQIDPMEAVEYWDSGFGKISAKELFRQVDFDDDKLISEKEFARYWRIVRAFGHEEEEIMMELKNI